MTSASNRSMSASIETWAALVVAVAGLSGSLFLSLGMHLKACPLCFYQRTFMMSLAAVLGMGLLLGVARLGLLTLPLAVAGLGIALLHVSLEIGGLALGNFAAPAANADDSKAFFERRIAPILSESCAGCHNGDKLRGGLDLKALVLHSCRRGCVVNPDNDHP